MADTLNIVKFIDGTEAQILALTPSSSNWVEKAFYYPTDKTYFYRALNGVMEKYGAGDVVAVGVGCTLNGKVIGGVKAFIESDDTLVVPENFDYNTFSMKVDGDIILAGEINIL